MSLQSCTFHLFSSVLVLAQGWLCFSQCFWFSARALDVTLSPITRNHGVLLDSSFWSLCAFLGVSHRSLYFPVRNSQLRPCLSLPVQWALEHSASFCLAWIPSSPRGKQGSACYSALCSRGQKLPMYFWPVISLERILYMPIQNLNLCHLWICVQTSK